VCAAFWPESDLSQFNNEFAGYRAALVHADASHGCVYCAANRLCTDAVPGTSVMHGCCAAPVSRNSNIERCMHKHNSVVGVIREVA